jgi:hypothetical protein
MTSKEDLTAEIAKLRAENEALKKTAAGSLRRVTGGRFGRLLDCMPV